MISGVVRFARERKSPRREANGLVGGNGREVFTMGGTTSEVDESRVLLLAYMSSGGAKWEAMEK